MYVYGTQTCALNSKDAYFLLTFSIIFTQLSSFAAGPPLLSSWDRLRPQKGRWLGRVGQSGFRVASPAGRLVRPPS